MKILLKLLVLLAVLIGAVYLFNDKIPTDIREKIPFIDIMDVSEGDKLFPILKEFETAVGVTFSDPYETSFRWFVEDGDSIVKKEIKGTGIKASMIKDPINTFNFLESKGYMFSQNNIADGTIFGLEGFQKGNNVCVVIKTSNGELNEYGVIEGQVFTDIEIRCGQLENEFNAEKKTIEQSDELTAIINTNKQGDIAGMIIAPNNEVFFALRENVDGVIKINKLGFITAYGHEGIIHLNENQKPESMDFEGTKVLFSNYTDETVDIIVTRSDGTTEFFQESRIIPPTDLSAFIPTAHADTEEVLVVLDIGINVIRCGAGLGSILFSGGVTSPLSYTGCASLSGKLKIHEEEIDNCEKISTACVIKALAKYTEKIGPDFLKKGLRLKGMMSNSITGSPITSGTIKAISKRTSEDFYGELSPDGSYELYFRDGGAFDVKTVAVGFTDSSFATAISSSMVQIWAPERNNVFQYDVDGKDYDEIEIDLFIDPEAYIKGEIIDTEEGMPIKDAIIKLYKAGKIVGDDFTEEEGLFWVQPPLSEPGTDFTLNISADGYNSQDIKVTLPFEVIKHSDEYFIEDWSGIVKLEPDEMTVTEGVAVSGTVVDVFTKQPIGNTTIKFIDNFDSDNHKDLAVTTTNNIGQFSVVLPHPTSLKANVAIRDIIVHIKAEGYPEVKESMYLSEGIDLTGVKEGLSFEGTKVYVTDYNHSNYQAYLFDGTIEISNFDGAWRGEIKPDFYDLDEETICQDATLGFSIKKGKFSRGSAQTDQYLLDLTATLQSSGSLQGGMATADENVADFTGILKEDGTGSGTWSDAYGCRGTFTATRKLEVNVWD